MNWDEIKGNFTQIKGQMRERWGELTDDDLQEARGEREQLIGTIQKRYGIAKEEAEKQVDEWQANL